MLCKGAGGVCEYIKGYLIIKSMQFNLENENLLLIYSRSGHPRCRFLWLWWFTSLKSMAHDEWEQTNSYVSSHCLFATLYVAAFRISTNECHRYWYTITMHPSSVAVVNKQLQLVYVLVPVHTSLCIRKPSEALAKAVDSW